MSTERNPKQVTNSEAQYNTIETLQIFFKIQALQFGFEDNCPPPENDSIPEIINRFKKCSHRTVMAVGLILEDFLKKQKHLYFISNKNVKELCRGNLDLVDQQKFDAEFTKETLRHICRGALKELVGNMKLFEVHCKQLGKCPASWKVIDPGLIELLPAVTPLDAKLFQEIKLRGATAIPATTAINDDSDPDIVEF